MSNNSIQTIIFLPLIVALSSAFIIAVVWVIRILYWNIIIVKNFGYLLREDFTRGKLFEVKKRCYRCFFDISNMKAYFKELKELENSLEEK